MSIRSFSCAFLTTIAFLVGNASFAQQYGHGHVRGPQYQPGYAAPTPHGNHGQYNQYNHGPGYGKPDYGKEPIKGGKDYEEDYDRGYEGEHRPHHHHNHYQHYGNAGNYFYGYPRYYYYGYWPQYRYNWYVNYGFYSYNNYYVYRPYPYVRYGWPNYRHRYGLWRNYWLRSFRPVYINPYQWTNYWRTNVGFGYSYYPPYPVYGKHRYYAPASANNANPKPFMYKIAAEGSVNVRATPSTENSNNICGKLQGGDVVPVASFVKAKNDGRKWAMVAITRDVRDQLGSEKCARSTFVFIAESLLE